MKISKKNKRAKGSRERITQRFSGLKTGFKTNFPDSKTFNQAEIAIETPLDVLYNSIEKKGLKINQIMEKFDLTRQEALEWCEILRNKDLVELKHSIFRGPVLKLKKDE